MNPISHEILICPFQPPKVHTLVDTMCKTIVLNNGTKWKTLAKATSDDIATDKMVLICPRCNIAYVVQARTVRAVPV